MTARAVVLGKRPDGSVRRYTVEPETRLLHVLATRTGHLAYCGYRATTTLTPGSLDRAQEIETLMAPETQGLGLCPVCSDARIPGPLQGDWT